MIKVDYENWELEEILKLIDNEELDLLELQRYIWKDNILFNKTKILW